MGASFVAILASSKTGFGAKAPPTETISFCRSGFRRDLCVSIERLPSIDSGQELPELAAATGVAEPAQGAPLNLADALPGDRKSVV